MDLSLEGCAASGITTGENLQDMASNGSPAGFSVREDHREVALDLHAYLVRRPAATFFVRVTGKSYNNLDIHPGDLLIVDRSLRPRPGKLVVAVINGEFCLARLDEREQRPCLVPVGQSRQAVPLGDGSDASVWGLVMHSIHRL